MPGIGFSSAGISLRALGFLSGFLAFGTDTPVFRNVWYGGVHSVAFMFRPGDLWDEIGELHHNLSISNRSLEFL